MDSKCRQEGRRYKSISKIRAGQTSYERTVHHGSNAYGMLELLCGNQRRAFLFLVREDSAATGRYRLLFIFLAATETFDQFAGA